MLQIKKLSSFADLTAFESLPVPFFQSPQYLQVFAKNFCKTEDLIMLGIFDNEKLIGYGAFEKIDDKIIFLGMKHVLNNQELTDYGDIWIKEGNEEKYMQAWEEILKWFRDNGFKNLELDYVREESKTYKFFNVCENSKIEPQEVAPYITLPKSWEEYISGLEYHNRRELRRKMNRLDRELGANKYLLRCVDISEQSEVELKKYFAEFIRLVKLAEDKKQQFMTPEMEKFFWDLVNIKTENTWRPVLNFLEIEGKPVAAILTFENGAQAWAYNSGYDPAYKFYSAGLLIHAFKIRDLIENKFKKYDFLRGNERYKYDLGAIDKKMYNIQII